MNENNNNNNDSTIKSNKKISTSKTNNNKLISNISKQKIDYIKLQKMSFIYNAIQSGWNVKKERGKYIFTKRHHNKKEYFYDSYLKEFIESNIGADTESGLVPDRE
jgi:hypothetical protein